MWSIHHRDCWKDLDSLEELTDVGRRLDAGGFILADPFEIFLRNISTEYLSQAWERLASILETNQIDADDLSWGFLHPGETYIPSITTNSPLNFIGWTSRRLADFNRDSRYSRINEELKNGYPSLCCTVTWRSLKWRIAPDNYELALRLIEALCTDEISDWSPHVILEAGEAENSLWHKIAKAILDDHQQQLNQTLAQAKSLYSPLGFRIIARGFALNTQNGSNLVIDVSK